MIYVPLSHEAGKSSSKLLRLFPPLIPTLEGFYILKFSTQLVEITTIIHICMISDAKCPQFLKMSSVTACSIYSFFKLCTQIRFFIIKPTNLRRIKMTVNKFKCTHILFSVSY